MRFTDYFIHRATAVRYENASMNNVVQLNFCHATCFEDLESSGALTARIRRE